MKKQNKITFIKAKFKVINTFPIMKFDESSLSRHEG